MKTNSSLSPLEHQQTEIALRCHVCAATGAAALLTVQCRLGGLPDLAWQWVRFPAGWSLLLPVTFDTVRHQLARCPSHSFEREPVVAEAPAPAPRRRSKRGGK